MTKDQLTKLITEVLGERCPEHHEQCMTCAAWWMFDRLSDEPDGERSLRRAEKPCGIVFHISPADNRCLNCGWTVLDHAHGPQWHMSEEHQAACTGCNRKEK